MTKRERYIGIGTVAVLAVLGLDHFFVAPLWASRDMIEVETVKAENDVKSAKLAILRRARDAKMWSEFAPALKRDASATESQLRDHVLAWAQFSGMSVASTKLDRAEKEKDFYRITIHY